MPRPCPPGNSSLPPPSSRLNRPSVGSTSRTWSLASPRHFDATPALWGWEVDDPTWDAAIDAIDVAMRVAVLDMEGRPVSPGMRAAHRLALEIAGPPPEAASS
jgi:hypothetical protein